MFPGDVAGKAGAGWHHKRERHSATTGRRCAAKRLFTSGWAQQESQHALVTRPSVLMLQLKRFHMHSGQVQKLHHSVSLACTELFVPSFVSAGTRVRSERYYLTAAVLHYGRTPHSRYYGSLCKSPEREQGILLMMAKFRNRRVKLI